MFRTARALIEGSNFGIFIQSASGTVVNYGYVKAIAATGDGVYLSSGTAINFGTVVAGPSGAGIYLRGTAGDVSNFGTILASGGITGAGVLLEATASGGGYISNASGGLI